jgi:hypothetical protein
MPRRRFQGEVIPDRFAVVVFDPVGPIAKLTTTPHDLDGAVDLLELVDHLPVTRRELDGGEDRMPGGHGSIVAGSPPRLGRVPAWCCLAQ